MQMRLNLRPGKRSLVAKVEDEAGVHDVFAFNPGHSGFNKFHFIVIRQNPCQYIINALPFWLRQEAQEVTLFVCVSVCKLYL